MTEIFDFWNALRHEAWVAWDGLLLFQTRHRPIDRALGGDGGPVRAVTVEEQSAAVPIDGVLAPRGRGLGPVGAA